MEGVHKRHAHLQKCPHSKGEQSRQKIKEVVEVVGVVKGEKVVVGVEEECKEV